MSREDGILASAFGTAVAVLALIPVLITYGSSASIADWVQAFGSVAAIGVAVFVVRLQNRAALAAERRALDGRVNTLRVCLATEIRFLLAGTAPFVDSKNDTRAIARMTTITRLKVRIYPEVISQIGILGSAMAGAIAGIYAHLDLLMYEAREIDREIADIADFLQWKAMPKRGLLAY